MLFCPGAGNGLWGTLQSVCVEREMILSAALYFFTLSTTPELLDALLAPRVPFIVTST